MAGEVKYGNTLISSRKDGTLTYARYVKDLQSGKSVEELLQELRSANATIPIDELDSLNQSSVGEEGQPVVYAVTQDERNVGVLQLFSDSMGHLVTQVLTTHNCWNGKDFNAHDDVKLYTYRRSYNIAAPHATWSVGTWSEWEPFVDSAIMSIISAINTSVKKKADLGDDGKVSSDQLPSYVDDVVEFGGIVENIAILAASTSSAGNVVYDKTTKRFALAVQNGLSLSSSITYWGNWTNRDDYQSVSDDATATPYAGKIFIDTSTNKAYRWNGSDLAEISSSLNLGETSDTAFAGDRGLALETGMAEVKSILNTKGAKNGLAPLDENRLLAEKYLPSSAIDVVEFGGFADGITILEESVSQISSVVFDREQNRFAGADAGSSAKVYYYNNWTTRYLYSEDLEGKPIAGKLYVNTGDRKIYRWTGEQMEEVSARLELGVTADTAFAGDKGAALEQDMTAAKTLLSKKADLGDDGKVPSSQLPSYVSEALEFTGILDNLTVHSAATTLTTGYVVYDNTKKTFVYAVQEDSSSDIDYYSGWPARSSYEGGDFVPLKDKVFVDTGTKKTYRWSGSDIVEVSATVVLGETATTAFPGDRGLALETNMAKKADLGDDGKMSASQLPDSATDVVEFGGFVYGVEITAASTGSAGTVVYDGAAKQFALRVSAVALTATYFGNWTTRGLYEDDSLVPLPRKLYVDTANKKIYRWTGEDLEEVSGQLAIGETADTAFAGDRGVALETDMASVKGSLETKAEKSDVETIETAINKSVTTETSEREAADTAEAAERKSADEKLQGQIDALDKFAVMTEDEYDALETKDENTYYMLTED